MAQPVRWACTTMEPVCRALATPLLSSSGVNGLGIWSTTLANSVYWANARFRMAELMTTGIRAVCVVVQQLAADLVAGRAGELVVQEDQVGPQGAGPAPDPPRRWRHVTS